MKSLKILCTIFSIVIFSSCNPFNSPPEEVESIVSKKIFTNNQDKIESIINSQDKVIPTIQENSLFFSNTSTNETFSIYTFKDKEKAPVNQISRYVISPSNQFVVWYNPINGFTSLDVQSQSTSSIHQPSDFLNVNPYISFLEDEDTVAFISDNGNIFNKINLLTNEQSEIAIPYPYGNLFRISPDKNNILFIAGYGQSENQPKYMFTNIDGSFKNEFTTETDIADRHLAIWAPDSSGAIIVNDYQLNLYPTNNPKNPNLIFEVPNQKHIIEIDRKEDNIFILDEANYWHIYNYSQQKRIAMTPTAIASELQNPKFIPWTSNEFLIEETISDGDIQFNRIWISDFKGNKNLIVPSYNKTLINTEPLIVE